MIIPTHWYTPHTGTHHTLVLTLYVNSISHNFYQDKDNLK